MGPTGRIWYRNHDGKQSFFDSDADIERSSYLDMPNKEQCAANMAAILKEQPNNDAVNRDPRYFLTLIILYYYSK